MIFLITLCFLVSFVIRSLPRFILPYGIASDTYFHMYYVAFIRKNKFSVPESDPRFKLNDSVDYPFFFHFLLAITGERFQWVAERFSSAFFDSISCVLTFLITYQFTTDYTVSFISAIFFAIAPVLFKSSDEPRVFHGSTRVLAQLLYFLHIYGLVLSFEHFIPGSIICVVFGSFIFFTTVFGIQVIIFFSIVLSLFNPIYLLYLIAAFVFSIIITKGRTVKILKLNFKHSVFLYRSRLYYQTIQPRRDLAEIKNVIVAFIKFIISLDFFKVAETVFSPPSSILKNLISFHTFLVLLNFDFINSHAFLYIWSMAGLILFLLTKLPNLRFLGKPERYFEFSLPANLALFAIFITTHFSIIYLSIYVLICLLYCSFFIYDFVKDYRNHNQTFLADVAFFEKFNQESRPGLIWTLHPFMYKPMYFTKYPLLAYFAGTINPNNQSQEEKEMLMGNYPYPGFALFETIKHYGVDYIITEKAYFGHYLNKAGIDFSEIKRFSSEIAENDNFIIIKLGKNA